MFAGSWAPMPPPPAPRSWSRFSVQTRSLARHLYGKPRSCGRLDRPGRGRERFRVGDQAERPV